MKKILLLILSTLLIQNICYAENISFVYINGSNNNNEKMKNWFLEGVNKLHPKMKRQFEKRVFKLFPDKKFVISKEPVIFFWGDKSHKDLAFVETQLDMSKALSSSVAYTIRQMLTEYMHDAIWVQKSHHMLPILDDLHETVKTEYKNGNSVILYGYSAGTFITYEYLFNKLPYINTDELFSNLKVSDETKEFVHNNPRKNTCISALAAGKIGIVSSAGYLVTDPHEKSLRENYLKLDEATDFACVPHGAVNGVVNFASPLVLFYSDLADPDYEQTYYNKLMFKYILENDLFFLTVNFREDPLGYPSSRNLTNEEMSKISGVNIENPNGFVYDNSAVWSRRPCFVAHTSYWSARGIFSKAVAKSFVEGYKFQYDPKVQKKILKRNKKLFKENI